MKDIDNFAANNPNVTQLSTKGKLNAGGVVTRHSTETRRNGDSFNNFIKTHKKGTTESMLKGSSEAKNLMRNEALALSEKSINNGTFVPQEVYKRPPVPKETGEKFLKEGEQLAKKGFKLGKGGKWAIGITAATGLGYGAKKLYDKNKK